MAAKKFGAVYIDDTMLNAGHTVAIAPDGTDATVIVNFCNQSEGYANVSLGYASATATSLEPADMLMHKVRLRPSESYQFATIALEANHGLYVRSDAPGVSVIAYGWLDTDE